MVEEQISPIVAICTVQISEDEYEKRETREEPSHRRDQRTCAICRVAEADRRKASEGLGVAEWCERQGISKSAYYYSLRKIREYICQLTGQQSVEKTKAEEKQQIIPIQTSVSTPCENRIEIISGDLRISFVGETAPSALKAVIEALRSC